uniref:Gustatory receptor n=1 Tax=Pyrrhalta aenescens TaxID=281545 RepID=A0A1J0KL07_9CUCU|nr:gustatory receptor 2 [Pyrrhalta aenescens]
MLKSEKSLKLVEKITAAPPPINADFKLLTNYLGAANFFGVIYFFNKGYCFKTFGLLLTILVAGVAFFSFKVQKIIYENLHPTLKGMSIVLTVTDTVFLTFILVSLMLRKREHWKKLFETMHIFENILNTCDYLDNENGMWRISLKIILISTTILHSIYSLYYYIFENIFEAFQIILVLRGLVNLYLILITTFYLTLTNWLRNRYTFMHKYLTTTITKPGYFLIVRKVIITFKLAETVVQKTNHLFGSIIFTSLAVCVINILYYFVLALDLTSISTEAKCINYIAPLIYAVFLVVLTMSCNSVETSGHSLIKTCYLLHESAELDVDKDHLMLLVKYVEEWRPIFSAAGFYDVNQASLSSIFSSIITYLVIAIQFNMVLA